MTFPIDGIPPEIAEHLAATEAELDSLQAISKHGYELMLAGDLGGAVQHGLAMADRLAELEPATVRGLLMAAIGRLTARECAEDYLRGDRA